MVLRVGLTGGIAAGKSEVSARLAQHGALVIDADRLAREAVQPGTPGHAEVVIAFGPELLDTAGGLDRAALGRRIFADESARQRLEAILHPRVRARAAQIAAAAPAGAVVVHDIPLLVETGQVENFDVIVVVDCPVDVQLRRLTEGRGLSLSEAKRRIAAQASRPDRLAAADYVIETTGSLDDLQADVDALWLELQSRGGEGSAAR